MSSPKKAPISPKCPQCGTPTKVTVADIFPTTSPLMQYEHRAGVLDYPSPKKPSKDSLFSPSQQKAIRERWEAETREEYIQQVRDRWTSPSKCSSERSGRITRRKNYESDEENQSPKDRRRQQVEALEDELTQERQRTSNLEGKLSSLTRATRNLVGAIKETQNILKNCVDDPATQSVLDF
jgi:chromosome segregation ATPase